MMLRINARHKRNNFNDYELIDILRALSMYDRNAVIGRHWRLSDLEFWPYALVQTFEDDIATIFPEFGGARDASHFVVDGERLMERSALVHQFECGWFLRIVNPEQSVVPVDNYRLWQGPPVFQASNTDLEIRIDESPYEIVSQDSNIIACLRGSFAETEIVE